MLDLVLAGASSLCLPPMPLTTPCAALWLQGADREAARLMESAEFISGPISTERQQLEAALDQNR